MEKKICGVYQVINMVTGDSYIGSSKNVWLRISNHKCHSKYLQCPHSKLYQAYQEYEKSAFLYRVLEECDASELKQREQKWINIMKPTYNTRSACVKAKKAC